MNNRVFSESGGGKRMRLSARLIAFFSCSVAISFVVLGMVPYNCIRMADVNVQQCTIGIPMEVSITVVNWSPRSVEVLGSADTCGTDGCIEAMFHRRTISAWSTSALGFKFEPSLPGAFRKEVRIHLDRAEQPILTGWLCGFAEPCEKLNVH